MSFFRTISVKDDIEEFVLAETQKLAINIDREVVRETPVDTGRAKGNWLASVGVPDTRQLNVTGSTEGAAIQQAVAVIGKAIVYQLVYIQNNLPYIQRLNNGWSLQQPNPLYVDNVILRNVNKR